MMGQSLIRVVLGSNLGLRLVLTKIFLDFSQSLHANFSTVLRNKPRILLSNLVWFMIRVRPLISFGTKYPL